MLRKSVSVVVLGDVGRSPRMQYHSLSFAREGYVVDVIGYGGSEVLSELRCHENVNIRTLSDPPDFRKYTPALIGYILKALWQAFSLFFTLIWKRRSHHVVVQNVPAVPTLAVCWVYCLLTNAKFIIDWHNYSYSILALAVGKSHVLYHITRWFEGFFGQRACSNLCVTRAMKDDLKKRWNISATTLYDRPPEQFHSVSLSERHDLFEKLAAEYPLFGDCGSGGKTTFTELRTDKSITLRSDRPGLLVSSTSWTEDEDFSVLLSALSDYEEASTLEPKTYPRLVCVITGKGPLKDYYCKLMQDKAWKHIQVVTPWLAPEDYPLLLGSADLGVCLHISSSGLDLPMKVVDMFGCGLPVCAFNFPCLKELVSHEENSFVFNNASELANQILSWFEKFPVNSVQIQKRLKFGEELKKFQELRWHDNWKFNVLPLIEKK
ncbi:chitobiosyldiphosphodolichol beta-mannosyltransferase [Bacillus rossius redtenbacheri]|uniref:chitobiosyldiphosphodolichol beta-mannosyltransferase n=1 Tax=Bacillus rossius redtenbacheri TaxID=93214 RepID=UPI002FDCF1AF